MRAKEEGCGQDSRGGDVYLTAGKKAQRGMNLNCQRQQYLLEGRKG